MEDAMIDPSNRIVQGFWTGPLTTMERLSIASFLANGHDYHLYCYDEPAGVPAGAEARDARAILPESEIATFRCAQQFSDWFRIALLLKKGGWHSDLDNVCLRPLDLSSDYVFYRDYDEITISLALAKAPAGSPLLQHCYDFIDRMGPDKRSRLSWQEIGSEFILGAVEYFNMTEFAQLGRVFDPVHHERVRDLVDPAAEIDLTDAYSIHLFHAAWNDGPVDSTGEGFDLGRRLWGQRLDTNASYSPDCLYERLKRRFNVTNDHAN
jgi:hypothetical protein